MITLYRLLPLALASVACSAPATVRRQPPPPSPPALTCGGRALELAPSAMRRLTRQEYRNSIKDLFGITPPAATDLPEDGDHDGLVTTAGQHLTAGQTTKYVEVAAELAATMGRDLPRFLPCATDALDDDTCVRRFLTTTGTRMFRRRLHADEIERLHRLFREARAAGRSFTDSAVAMLQAMLVSPQFLFLSEGIGKAGVQPLTSWQIASRLSFTLWQTTPDALLLEAAARDELRTPSVLAAHVRRMLDDDRARPTVAAFFEGWLGLGAIDDVQKDPAKHPAVKKEVVRELAKETRRFVADTFWREEGRLDKLLVSPLRMRNKTLAMFYGEETGKDRGEDPGIFEVPPTEKSFGLLSQAGFLMAMAPNDEASIIYRGKFVRRRLLCAEVPPPPPGVATPLPRIDASMTSRERIDEHTGGPSCYSCHADINPLGYVLENFDGSGRWRDSENGRPIDSASEIDDADIDGPVTGALDLSRKLARSKVAQRCAVEQLFSFVFQRPAGAADACVLNDLESRFRASGGSLKALLVDIAASPAMLARAASP